ncbi:hypothetical protein HPB51_029810 [Rhipicephalus microplus]|uniref:Uncharacterized protein n=1 Tax=Rhipicephalus microplus TaxID=6941 RepID=A0A9J6CTE0_RHIMP|nr:hypothetical protein HPB51_029810 [Rhipicephalus microplus]
MARETSRTAPQPTSATGIEVTLRSWRPLIKGGSPRDDVDLPPPLRLTRTGHAGSLSGFVRRWHDTLLRVGSHAFHRAVVMLMVSRAASGIWLGSLACCSSLYVTDVAPPRKRAFYGRLNEVDNIAY